MINVPYFYSDNGILNRAARIAIGDIAGNCIPYRDGLLNEEKVCIMAGLDYNTPWTRDAAINTMNAISIMDKDVAINTLLSVCEERNGKKYIGGQYWDAIIWAIGAWQYYLVNNDEKFLQFSLDVVKNSLEWFEETELDVNTGLFMGAAVYGDGVAAYPDKYAKMNKHETCILDWPESNKEKISKTGFGIPMKALSTNCVYYAAYMIVAKMCILNNQSNEEYLKKAQDLKDAINKYFWNSETGRYDYLFDDEIRCDSAEALGLAFAVLFGVADKEKCDSIIKNTYVTEHGIACVWPSFERYRIGNHYGRHAGTVWPHAQGYWAMAMLKANNPYAFDKELFEMAYKAVKDMQFAEIYHPISGEIYGGAQENFADGIIEWKSCEKQTWSATAFWLLIFYGIIGLEFGEDNIKIAPHLPRTVNYIELKNLNLGNANITIIIEANSGNENSVVIPKNIEGNHIFYLSC